MGGRDIMITINLTDDELSDIKSLAADRHDAKPVSFRNTGILIDNPSTVYAPHTVGLIGEYAWGKHTGQKIDSSIYDVRDDGEDFAGTEVKTITYTGSGEPELKIKKSEFLSKTPQLYVLARVNQDNLHQVHLLATISRKNFDSLKKEKQYGENKPLNYIVPLSLMDSISSDTFYDLFSSYDDCSPPGVRLPEIVIEEKYYKKLNIDPNSSNASFLRQLCEQGLLVKDIDSSLDLKDYKDRLEQELVILEELGFTDYILLNWDILNHCHEEGIPTGPGRGSAAGSLVLYLIGVTQVDPVKNDLFFERFVSKSRAKKTEKDGVTYLDGSLLADVDNDIAYEHRQKVIDYIDAKHPSRTAKILTLNTLSGKLCIKECGKIVGGKDEQEVNLISAMIPKKYGEVMPLSEAYNESPEFKDWVDLNKETYSIALKLEGLNKNTGVHPSGIAISYLPIREICPLQLTADGAFVTGYDMNWVSELMVKFDILGLRTLSVIYDVSTRLNKNLTDIDLESYETFSPLDKLASPHGLFQIEADTNYRVCKKVRPKTLEELSAVVALARPGALDFVDSYSTYTERGESQSVHPFFDDILSSTGGIPLYQEQLMQMAVKVGFTLDEAEQLRRIVGKKKVSQMAIWEEKIKDKIRELNLDEEVGSILWRVAEDSANYSFNKSHAISYATLAAWTVKLKFSYPKEFFLSLLRMTKFEPAPQEEISKISKELSSFSIELLAPDLARSQMDFALEGDNIRFGLNSIKGVSEKSLIALHGFRESLTPTKFDIFIEARQAGLNIGILSALIQAGTLSSYKSNRSLLVLEAQSFNILTDREKRNVIQLGEKYDYELLPLLADARDGKLIGDDGRLLMSPKRFDTFYKKYQPYKNIYEKNKKYEKFANWYFETQLLGYSYTTRLKDVFNLDSLLLDSHEVENSKLNSQIKFIGVVDDCLKGTSRNGNDYLKLTLSDEIGSVSGLFMNSRRPGAGGRWVANNRLDEYIEKGNKLPEKSNIALIRARKGDDVCFIDDIRILDKNIYMKLSDTK